jgi:hypothetical protein
MRSVALDRRRRIEFEKGTVAASDPSRVAVGGRASLGLKPSGMTGRPGGDARGKRSTLPTEEKKQETVLDFFQLQTSRQKDSPGVARRLGSACSKQTSRRHGGGLPVIAGRTVLIPSCRTDHTPLCLVPEMGGALEYGTQEPMPRQIVHRSSFSESTSSGCSYPVISYTSFAHTPPFPLLQLYGGWSLSAEPQRSNLMLIHSSDAHFQLCFIVPARQREPHFPC